MTLDTRPIAGLLCWTAVLVASPAPAAPLGFPGVDGTVRDGIRHNPPNVHLAVGPGAGAAGRVVMATSSGIQLWDKTGTTLAGPTPVDTFLGTAVGTAQAAKVLYDQHVGRFFLVALEGRTPNPGGTSVMHVAVSTSAAPGNLGSDWVRLSGSALTTIGGHETYLSGDGAGLGIGADASALYVTGNLVDAGNAFRGGKIRVFDTSATTGLLAGVYAFVDLDLDAAVTPLPFYLQPAHVHGATDSGNFYVVNRVNLLLAPLLSEYRVLEIASAPAAPTIVGETIQGWYTGFQVGNHPPQAGTTVQLDTVPVRVLNAVYRAGHIWAALTANWDTRVGTEIIWAKLATNGGVPAIPAIADLGILRGSDGVEWVFNPAIGVNAAGDAAICFTQSYFDQFPEMRCAARAASDPPGSFQASVHVAASASFYDGTAFPGQDFDFWGAHAATVVDPDGDATFWAANETVVSGAVDDSIWGTFVTRFDPPAPLPPGPPAPEAGGLVFVDVVGRAVNGGGVPGFDVPRALAISPDGRSLYTGGFQGLATLSRDAATGRLFTADHIDRPPGVQGAGVGGTQVDIEVAPDGRHVYVVARTEGLSVFARDSATGRLTLAGIVEADPFGGSLDLAEDIMLSPDGRHLYLANHGQDSIVVFARNLAPGALTFVQRLRNNVRGDGDVFGLRRPKGVAVSPDGTHVYTVHEGSLDSGGETLVVFSRDSVTGVLTHLETHTQGTGDAVGLTQPEGLAITSDGAHVYVISSEDDDSITAWRRDTVTGALTFVELVGKDTGVKNLDFPLAVAISPDDARVYVFGGLKQALLVFARDATTGRLTLIGEHQNNVGGVTGLVATQHIVPSPDGRHLYTVSAGDSSGRSVFQGIQLGRAALVTWARDACGSGRLTGLEQCDDGGTTGGDGCSPACRLELCPPAPRSDCRQPVAAGAASLQLKDEARDTSDKLVWKWKKGAATVAADFGDPPTSTNHLLCLYRETPVPELIATFAAPANRTCGAKPCWQLLGGGTGFKYDDPRRLPDGLTSVKLKQGLAGKASIDVKAQGFTLALPPLPLALPLAVQLTNDATGVCWEARYSTASRSDDRMLRARSD